MSEPIPKRPESLARIVREVNEEFAAQGRPLPLPPDETDDKLDGQFWAEVDRRMAIADLAAKHRGLLDYLADK